MKSSRTSLYGAASLGAIGLLLVFGPLLHLLAFNFTAGHVHRSIVHTDRIVSLPIVGIILLYLSAFVYHRRLLAAYIAACLSILTVTYLSVLYPYRLMVYAVAALTAVYVTVFIAGYKELTVKNSLEDMSRHLRRIGIIAAVGFAYGVFGFYFLGQRFFHTRFSLPTSIGTTIDSLTGFSGTIAEPTHLGQLFIDSLGGIGIVLFVLLLGALFRPLGLKIRPHQEHEDRDKAQAIIQARSASSEDFFKLWPYDKQYFFSPDQQAFLAYKKAGRTVVILGDPVGKAADFRGLVASFVRYCRSLGWSVAAINTTGISKSLLEKQGLKSLFVGNEGIVDIRHFVRETRRGKHFRYVANRAQRDKLKIEEWQDIGEAQVAKLRAISNAWLAQGGRREYTFFMGYFDRKYLRACRIFVLLQNDEPVAYVNLIPSFHKDHESLDQFRSGEGVSPVGMHFLLLKVIETLAQERAKTLNIGLSPLSGIASSNAELVPRAALRLMRLLGGSYYSFGGLEQFKNKFQPAWEPRSLLFTGTSANLLRVSRDIERASSYKPHGNSSLYISTVIGVVVLTLGLYFILG